MINPNASFILRTGAEQNKFQTFPKYYEIAKINAPQTSMEKVVQTNVRKTYPIRFFKRNIDRTLNVLSILQYVQINTDNKRLR